MTSALAVDGVTQRFGRLLAVNHVSMLFEEGELRVEAETQEHLASLLQLGGLSGKADCLVGELSHGDQRATEIAMALALEPRLLLLDEPTAGMSDHETFAIAELVERLHEDRRLTIVLIEHDMRVVFHLADRITVLSEGEVLAEGAPEDIAGDDRVQAAYLGEPR